MKVIETAIPGVLLLEPQVFRTRGAVSWRFTTNGPLRAWDSPITLSRITNRIRTEAFCGDCTTSASRLKENWFACCKAKSSTWPSICARSRALSANGSASGSRVRTGK